MSGVYSTLAMLVDFTHALAMLAWGLGLPLLFLHRFERLSLLYKPRSVCASAAPPHPQRMRFP